MMKVLCFGILVFIPLVYSDEVELWKTLDEKLEFYDNRIRPGSKDTPVNVNCSIFVVRFHNYNEKRNSVKVDIYFRQKWIDPRLEISANPNDILSTDASFLEKIWTPDTFFPGSHNVKFHKVPTDNSFVRIRHNGEVFTSQRINMEIFCQPIKKDWPRECDIEIESYGFSAADIYYDWAEKYGFATFEDEFLNQELKTVDMQAIQKETWLSTGNYTKLIGNSTLDKN